MDKKYYINNLPWGVFIFLVITGSWYYNLNDENHLLPWDLLAYGASALLFPLSKKSIENFALRYTSKKFWNSGILKESTAKNSLYVFYYFICYLAAIPISVIFVISRLYLKRRS